ncbi:hypothetical protein LIER_35829 [Lithospermum erythrorhizon]|uniref:LOB domain-containing protein n=1 Tax=Lithospermum erythrorhizon TaxID=34254 RepID=A0AAV3NX15_LITER
MVTVRVSCNGCRVLRKGCSEDCEIKPCLEWIKTPQAQANATLFLAKFYGRAGLLNLINAGPHHLRPSIFRSLLYEACGRIVNPIYGSTGLFCSGNWQLCEAAVQAVLSGSPVVQVSADSAASTVCPPLEACDIRHVATNDKGKSRGRFKRVGVKPSREPYAKALKENPSHVDEPDVENAARVIYGWTRVGSPSQESGLSHHREPPSGGGESGVEDSDSVEEMVDVNDIELELTL